MTREEYLKELDANLITLPREERVMAVRFYEEYFEDAGPEKEQEVIEELGKPYHLARTIIGETSLYSKSDIYIQYKASKPMPKNTTGVFASLQKPDAFAEQADTADDIMPQRAQDRQQDIMPNGAQNTKGNNTYNNYNQDVIPNDMQNNNGGYAQNNTTQNGSGMFDQYYTHAGESNYEAPPRRTSMSAGWIVFWVLMLIFVIIPIVIPTFLAIIAAMAAVAVASIACLIGAVIALVTGIIRFAVSIPSALAFIFASLICAGIGFVLLSASLAFFFKLLPWTIRSIFGLCSKRREA
ncbi:MAG: DUF1700 domain-containing protein [Oscillospiraceae bacterium]|nr:DUF1700 domain-containing protein [Oscillospiraceae bacterium]